jgi:hypothetical protein
MNKDSSTATRRSSNFQFCSDIFGASSHVGKSESFIARPLRISNAGSVVSDLKNKARWITAETNADHRRFGMTNSIAHGFLSDSQEIVLD